MVVDTSALPIPTVSAVADTSTFSETESTSSLICGTEVSRPGSTTIFRIVALLNPGDSTVTSNSPGRTARKSYNPSPVVVVDSKGLAPPARYKSTCALGTTPPVGSTTTPETRPEN